MRAIWFIAFAATVSAWGCTRCSDGPVRQSSTRSPAAAVSPPAEATLSVAAPPKAATPTAPSAKKPVKWSLEITRGAKKLWPMETLADAAVQVRRARRATPQWLNKAMLRARRVPVRWTNERDVLTLRFDRTNTSLSFPARRVLATIERGCTLGSARPIDAAPSGAGRCGSLEKDWASVWQSVRDVVDASVSLRTLRVRAEGEVELVEVYSPARGAVFWLRFRRGEPHGLVTLGSRGRITVRWSDGGLSVRDAKIRWGRWRLVDKQRLEAVRVVRKPLNTGDGLEDRDLAERVASVLHTDMSWIRGRWDGQRFTPTHLERRVYGDVEGAELVGALPVATSAVKVSSWAPEALFQGRPKGTYVVQPIGDVGGEAAPQHWVLVHRVR